jgi:phospholipid/cholesterol/gamma-HCH transport system substrate-binding protein
MGAELTSEQPARPRRRRVAEETRHILVGAAVFVGLAVLFAISAGSDGGRLGSYRVIAQFTTAEGVFMDSPVRLAGVQIGRVSAMDYDSGRQQAIVTMEIVPEIDLPLDSIAIITSEGMIGGRFIRMEPGGELDMLRDGDRLDYTQGSIMFEDLLEKIILTVEQNRLARREAEKAGADGGDSAGGMGQ